MILAFLYFCLLNLPLYTVQVYGTMSTERRLVTPYKHICKKCKFSNFIVIEGGYYYNVCHIVQDVIKNNFFEGKIINSNQKVYISLKDQCSKHFFGCQKIIFKSSMITTTQIVYCFSCQRHIFIDEYAFFEYF